MTTSNCLFILEGWCVFSKKIIDMRKAVINVLLLIFVSECCMGAENMSNQQGLKLKYDSLSYKENQDIIIQGTFSIFVKCGSQYAIWRQFPDAINYTLKNLDSGNEMFSINMELSINEQGNEIYEEFNKMPCNQIVKKEFNVSLSDVYFQSSQQEKISHFELQAEYFGFKSNLLIFNNKPFRIKIF